MYDVAILCGGFATRLGNLTKNSPKSMIDINGKPFIYHQLKLLEKNEFTRVILCVNHFGNQIEEYIKTLKLDMFVRCVYDGHYPLGTGGAIKHCLPSLGEKFFVLYGDSYLPINYKEIEDFYNKSNKLSLMTIYRNENYNHVNNVIYEDGKILKYDKNKIYLKSKHIDYGLGIFQKETFKNIHYDEFDLSLVYQDLIKKHQLCAFEVSQKFYEIGSIEGIEELKEYLKGEK